MEKDCIPTPRTSCIVTSPNFPTDFIDIGRPSLFFHELSGNDIGKESLGILPENFGNDSIFSNTFRESLAGIFNNTILDIGRESLVTVPSGSLEAEKLSLDKSFITNTFDDKEITNRLDIGFMDENISKTSSSSSNVAFSSLSLDGPSTIYSLSRKPIGSRNSEEPTNFKFSNSSSVSSIHSPLNKAMILSSDVRTRIKSLPVPIEENMRTADEIYFHKVNIGMKFWSAERNVRSKPALRNRSFHNTLDFDEKDEKDFTDSVFIEANHLAYKFSNNSIYEEDNDDVSSFSIDFPEESNTEENKEQNPKPNTEMIFKTVDKFLIPNNDMKIKLKSSKTESNSSEEQVLPQNTTSITNKSCTKKETSQNSSKISQASERDPMKILRNLSEILYETDKLSRSQKSESQSILNSLASILSEPRGNNDLEDSGHSSIEEPYECPIKNDIKISSKSKTEIKLQNGSTGEINRKYKVSKKNPTIKLQINTSSASVSSNNRSNSSQSSAKALSFNKSKAQDVKKGPMKAVIPIGNMTKGCLAPSTPNNQSELMVPKKVSSKRTSTPIHEPKLKPMAASTPMNLVTKNKNKIEESPLARPKISNYSSTNPKRNETVQKIVNKSLTSISKDDKKLVRRNSVNDAKISSDVGAKHIKITRSNSVGKETEFMLALNKVRQNIINSPYYQQKSNTGLSENSKGFRSSLPKPSNLALKMMLTGQENMDN